ncbi:galactose-1-epimerase [Saccharobesus litoralis]|uniref:Aldose 1-epimerase n=1 Tax=Saccharobesus litoralis TaxID=2172099 RepID=A0A2S0VMW2_9ALTE|nr:aldose epimerase family protein [Saccharobesus litoralis]AWB65563.1 galactose-1-epimerase [Saccharobesus litoralis]
MFTTTWKKTVWIIALGLALSGCQLFNHARVPHEKAHEKVPPITVSQQKWGEVDGQAVYLYTLKNAQGMTVKVSNWGGYVQSILVPDRHGKFEDVILGYDTWQEYYNDCCYSGPIVGRFGNRIAKGQFEIDGVTYQLTTNNGGPNNNINQLHGGLKGLHKRLWQGQIVDNKVEINYLSIDGEEGYPGNLAIKVTFSLDQNNGFKISYQATTDKKTPVNLTSHTYFNLSGNMQRDVEGQKLQIIAEQITPVDHLLIPTGALVPVAGTPFDFRQPMKIGEKIRTHDQQLKMGGGVDSVFGGYDHNWLFSDYDGSMKVQASLYDPVSGRHMSIETQEPALQFYAGNFMDGSVIGKGGKPVEHRYGIALEPQHYPDSPNQPHFPNTILAPGEVYQTATIYRFSLR